jgi:hypothetical protein
MSVIITFMFDPAKLQMNWAMASGRISLRAALVRLAMAGALIGRHPRHPRFTSPQP